MDKMIVVTGASSGIGASLARLLGARGASLVLAARREAELAKVAAESGALAVTADVTRRGDVLRIVDTALVRFGRVADYYSAEDVAVPESRPPWVR